MSFDKPECFHREEQIWNSVYDDSKKILRVGSGGKVTPKIERIEIANKDTEESFTLPKGVVAFSIRDRGNSRMRYAYESGEVENDATGKFVELGLYGIFSESELSLTADLELYFSSSKDARVIELVYWI